MVKTETTQQIKVEADEKVLETKNPKPTPETGLMEDKVGDLQRHHSKMLVVQE